MDLPEKEYRTVEDLFAPVTLKVKGSKFITHVRHASDASKAEASYQSIKRKFHDATHNCYAYRIDRQIFRYSDDREPSGTAGKPIFHVIEGSHLYQILVVVTRYFGGTKLGTGGLIQAYSTATKMGLDAAKVRSVTKAKTVDIIFSYNKIPLVENIMNKFQGTVIESEYKELVHMMIAVPDKHVSAFQREILPLIKVKEK